MWAPLLIGAEDLVVRVTEKMLHNFGASGFLLVSYGDSRLPEPSVSLEEERITFILDDDEVTGCIGK